MAQNSVVVKEEENNVIASVDNTEGVIAKKNIKIAARAEEYVVKKSVNAALQRSDAFLYRNSKDATKKMAEKTSGRVSKEAAKEVSKEAAKEATKETTKTITKEAAKESSKETAKVVSTETLKVVASSTASTSGTVIAGTAGTAVGTAVAPIFGTMLGAYIGSKAGNIIGQQVGVQMDQIDAGVSARQVMKKNFWISSVAKSADEETQQLSGSILKVIGSQFKVAGSIAAINIKSIITNPAYAGFLAIVCLCFLLLFGSVVTIAAVMSCAGFGFDGGYAADNYYCQYEEPWRDCIYGTQTIRASGCGPTTYAMVVSTLTEDTKMNPAEAAENFEEWGYCVVTSDKDTLTSWAAFSSGPSKVGLDSKSCGRELQDAIMIIEHKGMVVCSVGNSANGGKGNALFNGQGHFLAIRGVTEDGKLLILDPASRKNTEKEWDYDTVAEILKNCWQIWNPDTLTE